MIRDHPRSRGVYGGTPCPASPTRGSSPLARGLPAPWRPCTSRRRIIPARAGFTGPAPWAGCGPPDHPRSRGVYQQSCSGPRLRSGSSPLARGLHGGDLHELSAQGIIPARAGFTRRSPTCTGGGPDHPRSRGVYADKWLIRTVHDGSSPLARGLRSPAGVEVVIVGIIPARAGFTVAGRRPRRVQMDHPRSRGVYWNAIWGAVSGFGSSPLARGLRATRNKDLISTRIIPARAGFTSRPSWPDLSGSDHPRSRGVYRRACRRRTGPRGSSPLARGLRLLHVAYPPPTGIIPARAGFTAVQPAHHHPRPDHPRSRGVYSGTAGARARPPGSSPLARGLPYQKGKPSCMSSDHPRSRGVYGQASGSCSPPSGSSPLARGLRGPRSRSTPRTGIIPARAGFTVKRGPAPRPGRDHPRSRGVYDDVGVVGGCEEGSSPLARGLQAGTGSPLAIRGIIPARAGFTHPLQHEGSELEDHPRSRGVYGSASTPAPAMSGSSPLARGLPARPALPRRRPPDHPRSRGVYSPPTRRTTPKSGSSPLARGLPAFSLERRCGSGIIPARAGFTTMMCHRSHTLWDHPRSRGVYRLRRSGWRVVFGSSPLARGLQVLRARRTQRGGIIPARAGFTPSCPRRGSRRRDHPRSRGVYPVAAALVLAGGRIIPARAGFTELNIRGNAIDGDHPRSRGVYSARNWRPSRAWGSSPLARGLPQVPRPVGGRIRIIPACAGFTAGPWVARTRHRDHPRSRGVYDGDE